MFSFLRSDRLTPAWTYAAGSIIWRMVLAGDAGLVGECRDPENKLTSFFCVDLSTGRVLWKDLRIDEPWWVGIEAVQGNVVLLHGFAKPDMPEHKGITAVDATSGVQLWRNDDMAYWFGLDDRVIAYKDLFERRVGYELELMSGNLLKTHDGSLEELHRLRLLVAEEQRVAAVTLPDIFVEAEVDRELAAAVGKETKGKELSGRVEYIRQDDILVFNYHVQSRGGTGALSLENNLVIYRLTDNKRIFSDVIGRNLTGYVPDSFFVRRPFVLFIKEKKTLTAIQPWKS